MSATTSFDNSILNLIFQAANITNIADNTVTSPATVLYISLHTADPGKTGNQTTNESAYTSYARVSVARTSGGWTINTGTSTITNAGVVTFPTCTGGTSVITHFGIGLASTGTGTLLFSGALATSTSVSNNITPNYQIGDISINAN